MIRPLIYGQGFNDGSLPTKLNGKHLKEYLVWRAMICRCYSAYSLKLKPTYKGVEVCENFKSYSYFYNWCQNQVGFKRPDFVFDKDILDPTGRIYSEANCVFIPQALNKLLTLRQRDRSKHALGVIKEKGKEPRFKSLLNMGVRYSRNVSKETFSSVEEAHQDYLRRKKDFICQQAEKYRADLDVRVYEALMNFNLEERLSCLN